MAAFVFASLCLALWGAGWHSPAFAQFKTWGQMEIQATWVYPVILIETDSGQTTIDAGPAIASFDNFTRSSNVASQQNNQSLMERMSDLRLYTGSSGPKADAQMERPIFAAYGDLSGAFGPLFTSEQMSQVRGKNGIWLNTFGQWGRQKEDPGFLGYDYGLYGFTLGFDRFFGDRWIGGVAVGQSIADVDLDRGQGGGRIRNTFGSIYASYFTKDFFLDSVLSYGRAKFNHRRTVVVGSIAGEAASEHHGDTYSGSLGAGYSFRRGIWALGPYGRIQYTHLDEGAFQETGAESLNLRIDTRRTESLISELGIRLSASCRFKKGVLIPEMSAGWNYDFAIDDRTVRASLQGAPETGFSIRSQDTNRNGLIAGAGIRFVHESGVMAALRYRGDFRGDYQAHSLLGEFRFAF